MNVHPLTLEGTSIRLEPLTLGHAPELWPHVGPETFLHTLELPRDASYEAFEAWMRYCLGTSDSLLWALCLRETGEAVGMSGYLEIRPRHRGLEVGRTWIGPSHQGTCVNPESKYLLLRHAFEDLEAVRVQLKTDLNNLRSQRAIAVSLKRSAERSTRRKSSPFRSAMSMLTFYENRAGKNLSATRKTKIEQAKDELRTLYDRE